MMFHWICKIIVWFTYAVLCVLCCIYLDFYIAYDPKQQAVSCLTYVFNPDEPPLTKDHLETLRQQLCHKQYIELADFKHLHSGFPTIKDVKQGQHTILWCLGGGWQGFFPHIEALHSLNKDMNGNFECMAATKYAKHLRLPFVYLGTNAHSSAASLNFGREDDIEQMHTIYTSLVEAYPDCQLVIVAGCLGMLRIVKWMMSPRWSTYSNVQKDYLKALVMDSPVSNTRQAFCITPFPMLNEFCYMASNILLPNCRVEQKEKAQRQQQQLIDPHVPVWIGVFESDPISPVDALSEFFMPAFPQAEIHVERASSTHVHGHLHKSETFKSAAPFIVKALSRPKVCQRS